MRFAALYDCEEARDAPRIRRAVTNFLRSGEAGDSHSSRGVSLHHILNYCVQQGVAFELEYRPVERRYIVKKR